MECINNLDKVRIIRVSWLIIKDIPFMYGCLHNYIYVPRLYEPTQLTIQSIQTNYALHIMVKKPAAAFGCLVKAALAVLVVAAVGTCALVHKTIQVHTLAS